MVQVLEIIVRQSQECRWNQFLWIARKREFIPRTSIKAKSEFSTCKNAVHYLLAMFIKEESQRKSHNNNNNNN
jgi:hypothetical protein